MTDPERLRRAVNEDTYVGTVATLCPVLVAEIRRLRAERDRLGIDRLKLFLAVMADRFSEYSDGPNEACGHAMEAMTHEFRLGNSYQEIEDEMIAAAITALQEHDAKEQAR